MVANLSFGPKRHMADRHVADALSTSGLEK